MEDFCLPCSAKLKTIFFCKLLSDQYVHALQHQFCNITQQKRLSFKSQHFQAVAGNLKHCVVLWFIIFVHNPVLPQSYTAVKTAAKNLKA